MTSLSCFSDVLAQRRWTWYTDRSERLQPTFDACGWPMRLEAVRLHFEPVSRVAPRPMNASYA
jgi:hypothetical protein